MWEQEEYKKEGIDWTSITFSDNKPVLVSGGDHLLNLEQAVVVP